MGLAEIVHVELIDDVGALDRNARRRDHRRGVAARRLHPLLQRRRVEPFEHHVERLHRVVAQVRQHAAERRGDAGEARHQRGLEPELADERAGMQRAAAAERHGDKARRIVAALDRNQPDRARHARLGDPHDRRRGIVHAKLQRLADMHGDGAPRRLHVERFQLAAERALRIDPAERHLRVGQVGRVLPAP